MGLAALWREPFDHLARYAIHDFRSVSRLCGGLYSPLSFDKLVRSYQPPALYTNRNVRDSRLHEFPNLRDIGSSRCGTSDGRATRVALDRRGLIC
jgi:hypothetical protein